MGYLGSHTIVALQEAGYTVVSADNLSNSQPDVADRIARITGIKPRNYVIDVCDRAALEQLFHEEGPFAGVIHMAAFKSVAESVENPLKYYHNNLLSLLQVLHCCDKFGVKQLVFSSTCTVYGQPVSLPVTEETPLNPLSPYGKTKAIGEQIIRDFVNNHRLQAIALRFFNPVGAHPSAEIGEFPRGVPSNLLPYMAQVAAGLHDHLRIWGDDYPTPDGTCIRDFIHVCDLAEVHAQALEHLMRRKCMGFFEVFNIGTGNGISVRQMHKVFEEVIGAKINSVVYPRRLGDIIIMYANAEKAYNTLGWRAKYDLKDMAITAWNWQNRIKYSEQA